MGLGDVGVVEARGTSSQASNPVALEEGDVLTVWREKRFVNGVKDEAKGFEVVGRDEIEVCIFHVKSRK